MIDARDELAAAVTWTGEPTVAPVEGEHTVTPLFDAVQVFVLEFAPKISDIGVAVAAAAGNVADPRAVRMVRSILWC